MENIAEDIYTIIGKDSKKSIVIDLTTPFVLNSISTLINTNYEDIIIKNSIGEIIEEVAKESLLTITDKGILNEDVSSYFLSLVDVLFDPIEVEGYTYNKLYPLVELEEYEYGLVKGKIVTGKDIIVKIKGYELITKEVDVLKIVNYTNGNYFKRLDTDFTYYSEQVLDNSNLKNIVKLNNVSVEKGSLQISEYYTTGESYTSDPSTNIKYLNVNTLAEPIYLEVDNNTLLQE